MMLLTEIKGDRRNGSRMFKHPRHPAIPLANPAQVSGRHSRRVLADSGRVYASRVDDLYARGFRHLPRGPHGLSPELHSFFGDYLLPRTSRQ
jgi:hypothetical protein